MEYAVIMEDFNPYSKRWVNGLLYKKAGYVFTIHFEGGTEFKTIEALKLFKSLYSGYVVDSIIEKIQNYHFEC